MPKNILYILTAIACFFAIYSFTCAALEVTRWQTLMRVIALANTLFCCLTAGLVVYFYAQLTAFGVAYFVQEWFVVGIVVWAELRTIARSTQR